MIASLIVLTVLTLVLAGIVAVRAPERLGEALRYAREQGQPIALRIPLALLAATWLSSLIPPQVIGTLIGAEMGITGILIASALGAVLPGGPMVAFPVALVVFAMGAGTAQMVALLTAWAILALHRTLAFELPILGGRFVVLKLAATWMLAPLAGLIAAAFIALPL